MGLAMNAIVLTRWGLVVNDCTDQMGLAVNVTVLTRWGLAVNVIELTRWNWR